jgi:hypothetical protein
MYLRSFTREELISRGVDPKFARILADPTSYHPDLKFHIGKPHCDYVIPDGVTDVVPLWDVNADSIVRWNRNGVVEYVWLFHDDANWSLIAKSEQGAMAKLWQSWAEFQESDDELLRFADTIGFKHGGRALGLLNASYDEFVAWREELMDDAV